MLLLQFFLALLTLSGLLGSSALAQISDDNYSLLLPLQRDVATSLARIEMVVESQGGHLKTAKGMPYVIAEWPTKFLVSVRPIGESGLELQCSNAFTGGVKAFCEDLARRYQK